MSQAHTKEELQRAIEAQQGHAREYRPGTKLDKSIGKEISRTGREVKQRAVRGMPDVANDDVNPDGHLDLPPEKPNFTGQNANGGQTNR